MAQELLKNIQENTEDFKKMDAMEPNEQPYLKTSVWTLQKIE